MLSVPQDLLTECSEAAAALKLRMPIPVSNRVESAAVYTQLVHAAREPQHFIPLTPSLEVCPSISRSRSVMCVPSDSTLRGTRCSPHAAQECGCA